MFKNYWKMGRFLIVSLLLLCGAMTSSLAAGGIICTPHPFVAVTNIATPFSFSCTNTSPSTYRDFQISAAHVTTGGTISELKLSGSGCSLNAAYPLYYTFDAGATCTVSAELLASASNGYTMDFDLRYGGRLYEGIFCGNQLTSTSCLSTVAQPVAPNTLVFIDVTPNVTILPIGEKVQYKAVGTYDDGKTVDLTKLATWSSSDNTIASIEASGGYASTLASGTALISASYQDVTSVQAVLMVTTASLTSLNVTPTKTTIFTGVKSQFNVLGVYSDGSTADLTNSVAWNSSNPAVAVINVGDGLATAQGIAGSTNITASLRGITSNAAALKVTTAPLTNIVLAPSATQPVTVPQLPAGQTQQYVATGTYADGDTADISNSVTWATTNSNVGRISNTGLVTAGSVGATSITASSNSIKSKASSFNVSPVVTLTSIAVTPTTSNLVIGQSQQFVATGTYSDSSTHVITNQVTWNSATPATAVVSSTGLAIPRAVGSTNITASSSGVTSNTVPLTVAQKALVSIAVTPATASISTGGLITSAGTQQYTAIGTYNDSTTGDVTNQVTWSSSATGVATIANSGQIGLATAVAAGTTNITAALNGVTSPAAVLTVTVPQWTTPVTGVTNTVYGYGNNIYVGTNTGVTTNINASATWTPTNLGGVVRGIYANANAVYATVNVNSASSPDKLAWSTTSGASWTSTPIANQVAPNAVYALNTGNQVYVGTNKAIGMATLGSGTVTWTYPIPVPNDPIRTFFANYNSTTQIYAFYYARDTAMNPWVFKATATSATPTPVGANFLVTAMDPVNAIGVSTDGAVIVLASTVGARYTTQGNVSSPTFTSIPGITAAYSAYVSPDGNTIAVGTNAGIYISTNATAATPTWTHVTTGLASQTVNGVFIGNNVLYAATAAGLSVYK